MKLRFVVPAVLLLMLAGFLAYGLTLDPRSLPSALIDRPVPAFALKRLDAPEQTFSPQDMRGKVWLLNVWASWCVACREEHEALMEIARRDMLPVVGLSYKEVRGAGINVSGMAADAEMAQARERATIWLNNRGDPYVLTAMDVDGRTAIDLGVYGVPETFLIDGEGRIRYRHLGPITVSKLEQELLPMLRAAGALGVAP
ncbi:MAG: DsbE family thiol:disulfide interchange protein [Corticimicrobacter sp.]|uniref:DsbE family thiol:disulfide interchange protein n=1 Tax=Corticimicrobacter sp. TaxID=2678536 RepID=UPI0032DA2B3D